MNFWQLIWFFDSLSYSLQALYFFLNISGPLFRACLLLLLKCLPLCVNVLDAVEKKNKHRAKCLKSMSSVQPFRDECSRGVPYCRCLNYVDMVWNSVPCWGGKKRKRKSNREEENALHATLFNPSTPHCDPILHYVVVLQDFYESQWKALLLYQLELLHVLLL